MLVENCQNREVRVTRLIARSLLILVSMSLVSCSAFASNADTCDSRVSVADFLTSLRDGVGAIADSQYASIRMSAFDAYDATVEAMDNDDTRSAASVLQPRLQRFVQEMDDLSWDLSVVADSVEALEAISALNSEDSLQQANVVDAYMISRCGTVSTVVQNPGVEITLPGPVISQPNDSLPLTEEPNERSEAASLGFTVATAFNLTLSESEMVCLGTALTGVYDASGDSKNIDQYTQQFQSAFNNCNIDVVID